MGRDDRSDPRSKRGERKGPQGPQQHEPAPADPPVDLFSEDDLDAFLGGPAAAPPAEPPPLAEPHDFDRDEATGEIDLADLEEAADLEALPATPGDDLDFDAPPEVAAPAEAPAEVVTQHPALAAFSDPVLDAPPPARRTFAAAPPVAPSPAMAAAAPAPVVATAPAPAAPRGRAPAAPRAFEPPPAPAAYESAAAPEERTFLTDQHLFRAESQRLARTREWQALCAMSSAALDAAQWAQVPEARAGVLLDLACIYRDRLGDRAAAEETFARLATEDRSNREAIVFLGEVYAERAEWRPLHDLFANAVEHTWDPNQRVDFTRQAVAIARERLGDAALAIGDWERLWRLGEAPEITYPELTHAYRGAGRWDALAEFLADRASRLTGAERVVALREVAEVYLTGLRDQEKAAVILEELLAARPDDPIALLSLARVLARRQDWDGLDRLGGGGLDRLPKAVVLDFRRLVADAFWQANRLEQAVAAYERVLELDPADKDALKAKEEYLTRTEKYDLLLGHVIAQAERAAGAETRAELFARAAVLAEKQLDDPARAIELWEKRIALGRDDLKPFEALAELYETIGDLAGIARALEGQLALTKTPPERIELLRRLGDHFAHRLGDDSRAETCWKEILALSPTDIPTREELIALHRRRGNFEALDSALTRQIWIAAEDDKALTLARMAATNIDENISDANRAIDAWLRVLDYAPTDGGALGSLARHFEGQKRTRDLIATLEMELRVAPAQAAQVETAFRIAGLWEAEDARLAALGSYERVLRWEPVSAKALEALVRLSQGGEVGKAQIALEVASALKDGAPARIQLLRDAAALVDKGDPLGRFFWLARVLWLSGSDPKILTEVVHEAEAASAWPDLCAFYVRLAAAAEGHTRLGHYRAIARVYEEKLKDPVRAFLALQSVGLQAGAHAEVLQQLERLAGATGRHEDYLAVLEAQAITAASIEARQQFIRSRAQICETKVGDTERAFQEQRRLLDLDPQDAAARQELHRLAEKQGLWRQLDAVYGELWDRATSVADRIDIARARHAIRRDHLKDPVAALDQLLAIFRLDPLAPGILDELLAAAGVEKAWARVLPVVEAAQRAPGEAAAPADLMRTAALYEEKLGDKERALELYAEAFVLGPTLAELPPILERLAEATGRWERLAHTLRVAAARAPKGDVTLELYRRIAAIYEQKLGAPHRAIDIHRRILGLKPDEIPSLEVMIAWHRKREEWRDLRDRLRQWIEYAPKTEPREGRWLEIARISQQRLKDPEEALSAFAEVLDQNAQNEEAAQGLSALTADITDPQLELRRMRVELARAPKEARPERLLAIAKLLEDTLEDKPAAIETLRLLTTETGPAGPGYDPLTRLYRETGDWESLAQLLEDRAGAESDATARLARLDEAMLVCHEHLAAGPFERHERLYRKILADRPLDRDVRLRLARLLRQAGRFADLAAVLRDGIGVAPDADERALLRRELARVLDLALGGSGEAEQVLKDLLAEQPQHDAALLALAGIVARRKDITAYLDLRVKHAKLLPGLQAALVYCHLAEVCDETPALQPRVVQFYREARTLDPENVPAMEALKAVGRRLKNWRAQAALLPEPGEAQLARAERSSRLRWRGDQVKDVDAGEAVSWYWRAVAVDPDDVEAWEALAASAAPADPAGAFAARRAALYAYERRTAPSPERLREHAELIHKVGASARAAGDPATAQAQSRRAHDLVPEYAPAALSVAEERAAAGDLQGAFTLYDGALGDAAALSDDEKLHATFQRGLLSRQLGKHEQAIADLRATLRLRPLHAEALTALADELAGEGRVAAAIQHHLQSLLVVDEAEHRGRLYRELGLLWEDQLGNVEEAGVCYDLALLGGIKDRELMLRALAHYRRTGQAERALQVVEGLIPTTDDPRELAELWVARGDTYAEKAESQDTAIEAYDMALSYDPGCRPALDGLARVLEARGDWDQLLQILEARIDSGATDEKADALERMARICAEQLGDPDRAERYLRQLVDLMPSRAVLEQLLGLYGDEPARAADKRVVLGRLCAFGPPWVRRVIDLGKLLLDHAERRWAWCLLSPLVNVSPPPAELKQILMDLRKEFEKADNISALSPQAAAVARHPDDLPEITAVLAELGALVPGFGCATPEDTGGSGIAKIGENTALGKTFEHIRGLLETGDAGLMRAQELPAAIMIINSDPPKAVLRTEFLQLLGNAELAYVFAYVLELMRPGHRVVAAYPEPQWPLVVAGLTAGLGLGDAPPEAQPLCDLIRTQIDGAKRAEWAARLAALKGVPPQALGARYAFGMAETARRLGTIAAADLRLVIRVFSRIYDEVAKPKTVGHPEEVDDYLTEIPALQRLLAFAASPEFGTIVSR